MQRIRTHRGLLDFFVKVIILMVPFHDYCSTLFTGCQVAITMNHNDQV